MELVVAQVPEIMWPTHAGHGFLHATRSRHKHSDILIGCSAQGRYDFCKIPPIPHQYSLPSINVHPRERIKVNIYRGVNS